jgi:hypothetical protein
MPKSSFSTRIAAMVSSSSQVAWATWPITSFSGENSTTGFQVVVSRTVSSEGPHMSTYVGPAMR